MVNCLKIQLKGVIGNDNLDILGYVKAIVKPGTPIGGVYAFKFNSPGEIKVLNGTIGGLTTLSVNSTFYQEISAFGSVVPAIGYEYVTILIPKYVLNSIYCRDLDEFDMTKYNGSSITSMTVGSPKELSVDQSVFDTLTTFSLTGTNEYITEFLGTLDVTKFGMSGDAVKLSLSNVKSSLLIGSLNNTGCSDCELNVPNTKTVSLNIETYVSNHWRQGRTTSTKSLAYLGNCNCTFNGSTVVSQQTNTLSWEPNSEDNTKIDITLNGTTHAAVNPNDYL